MKTIQFDIDGVLADYCLGYSTIANRLFGSPVFQTVDMQSWNDWGLTKEQEGEMWKYIENEPNFWLRLPALVSREVFEQIDALSTTHHVVFVTYRMTGFPCPQQQTWRWLHSNGIRRPNVILSKHKGHIAQAIGANYSIEDKASNATDVTFLAPRCQSYLINRPYNRDETTLSVIRLNSVSEFLAEVQ